MSKHSDYPICPPTQKTDAQIAATIRDLVTLLHRDHEQGQPIWTVAACLNAHTSEQRRRHYAAEAERSAEEAG